MLTNFKWMEENFSHMIEKQLTQMYWNTKTIYHLTTLNMGRARYRSIDDCARYWAIFFFWGKMNFAHSFNSPVQLPLAHRDTAENVCLNHFFMIQLFILLALTSPNPNPSQVLALTSPNPNPSQVLVLALDLTITRAPRHRCRISFNIQLILAFPVS